MSSWQKNDILHLNPERGLFLHKNKFDFFHNRELQKINNYEMFCRDKSSYTAIYGLNENG